MDELIPHMLKGSLKTFLVQILSLVTKKPVVLSTGFTTENNEELFTNLALSQGRKAVLQRGAKLMPLGHVESPKRYLVLIESTGQHVILDRETVDILFKKGK